MSIEYIKRPKYKIVLNIDGINQLYENNKLKESYEQTCKKLQVLGGLTRLNSEPYKFKTIDYNYNCNICYVIHCYIKNNVLNNSDDIIIEIINIIQQYENSKIVADITEIITLIHKLLNKPFKINDDKTKLLMKKYNIELLYCENNGGIYNNRNKFIYNKDEICEINDEGNYKYPWILMLDDSDFCGFKNIGNNYIEDKLLEIYSNDDIWSYGMSSNPRSPGHISFWERIYKTKYLDNFVNLFGDMCDDGMNKIYSKIYNPTKTKINLNQHCEQFDESLKWCDYGDKTKTTIHLNPPPIFKYGNIINSYNPLTLQKDEQENFNTKVFNIESDIEKSVLEYVLQRYYIVLINNNYINFDCKITIDDKYNFTATLMNKNEENQKCIVDFNKVDLSYAKSDALPIICTNNNATIGYFINAGISRGSYTNPLKYLLKISEIDNLSNYTFYGYVKDLYQKIKDKSEYGNQAVQFMKIQPFKNRNDVLAISENVYYIKHDEIKKLEAIYVLRKFKNSADKTYNNEKITGENIEFKTLGGTYNINFKIILLVLIILITIIIIIVIIKNKIHINTFTKIKQ